MVGAGAVVLTSCLLLGDVVSASLDLGRSVLRPYGHRPTGMKPSQSVVI